MKITKKNYLLKIIWKSWILKNNNYFWFYFISILKMFYILHYFIYNILFFNLIYLILVSILFWNKQFLKILTFLKIIDLKNIFFSYFDCLLLILCIYSREKSHFITNISHIAIYSIHTWLISPCQNIPQFSKTSNNIHVVYPFGEIVHRSPHQFHVI